MTPRAPDEVVRVLAWNVESLGTVSSADYAAVHDVLARIDPDVIAFNEINTGELDELDALAGALGYPTVITPNTNPFGGLHNAILTRLPVASQTIWTSEMLSGDAAANDLTRWPVAVEVTTPTGARLAVVSQHWKSGFYTVDEFRRVIDGVRTAQAARAASTPAVLALGDVNAELDDSPPGIATWSSIPSDVPSDYRLGDDLYSELTGGGIPNDVFLPMTDAGLVVVEARQMDGRDATRDESGRRLDHVFADPSILIVGAEVYDARDESLGGLPKPGPEPERTSTETAADHFPVFVDVVVR
jgi:endonuclease/exonuclease/phosphatase family metal-dependent hydrolase